MTGDYYYLEELQFWANHNMINSNAGYRQQDQGILTCAMEFRGVAWALRQLIHAAAVSPDEDRGKTYFENKLANNLKYYNDFLAGRFRLQSPTQAANLLVTAKRMFVRAMRAVVGEYVLPRDSGRISR